MFIFPKNYYNLDLPFIELLANINAFKSAALTALRAFGKTLLLYIFPMAINHGHDYSSPY
jgi:hypothetical protein